MNGMKGQTWTETNENEKTMKNGSCGETCISEICAPTRVKFQMTMRTLAMRESTDIGQNT